MPVLPTMTIWVRRRSIAMRRGPTGTVADLCQLKEFDEVTDKRLLWDLIKYRIRQASIKYSKEKALKKRKKDF